MEFRELSEEEFRKFSLEHKYKSFFQTVETGLLREKYGYKKHFVGLSNNNKIIAATLLVSNKSFFGKRSFYAPRGYLINFDDKDILEIFTAEIKRYAKNNNGIYIKIDPYVIYKERDIDGNIIENGINNQSIVDNLKQLGYKHYGFTFYYDKTVQARWMFVLNLENMSEDNILKNMKQGTRTRINKTIKYNYIIKELTKDELNIFEDIVKQTGDRKGFDIQNLKYFENLYDIYSKENMVKFLLVSLDLNNYLNLLSKNIKTEKEHKENISKISNNNSISKSTKIELENIEKNLIDLNDKLKEAEALIKKYGDHIDLSSAMFITYGDEIIYLTSGNREEFMSLNGQYRIQWEMIKYGIKNNYKKYNFYGISGIFDPQDSQYGIYTFKRGFNGNVVELIGEFDLPVSNLYCLYALLRKLKRLIKR